MEESLVYFCVEISVAEDFSVFSASFCTCYHFLPYHLHIPLQINVLSGLKLILFNVYK